MKLPNSSLLQQAEYLIDVRLTTSLVVQCVLIESGINILISQSRCHHTTPYVPGTTMMKYPDALARICTGDRLPAVYASD